MQCMNPMLKEDEKSHKAGLEGWAGKRVEAKLLRNFETVAGPAHGLQITRAFRVMLNLFPELADINVHGSRADEGGFLPDRVQNLIAREDPTRVLSQVV